MGSHMGPKPVHLNDIVVSRYHRAQTFFFAWRSVSYLNPLPSPSLGIQHQGNFPNRGGKKLSPSSTVLFSSEGCSLNNYHVHWLVHAPAIRKKMVTCPRLGKELCTRGDLELLDKTHIGHTNGRGRRCQS